MYVFLSFAILFIFYSPFDLIVHVQCTFLCSGNAITYTIHSLCFFLNIIHTCHIAPIFILWLQKCHCGDSQYIKMCIS